MARKATIQDVAAMAGVAASTVSRVLNNHESVTDETKRKVLSAVSQLEYTPNTFAKSLRTRKSHLIGLVVPDISNPFYPEFARGLEDVATSQGYSVLIVSTDGNRGREEDSLSKLKTSVDGLVLFPLSIGEEGILHQLGNGYPVILCDARPVSANVNVVRTDDTRGAMLATEHLISLGCKRIAFVSKAVNAHQARFHGYLIAMDRAGFSDDPDLTIMVHRGQIDDSIVDRLQQAKVDGVVCINDITALRLIRLLHEHGVNVPQDLCVVGFDNIQAGLTNIPSLSTVDFDKYRMGRESGHLLFDHIDRKLDGDKRTLSIPPQLIVRESSMLPAKAQRS